MLSKIRRKILNIPACIKREWYKKIILTGYANKNHAYWKEAGVKELLDVRQKTLAYVESNQKPNINSGAYSYLKGGEPLLYASCYAALTLDLYGKLDYLSEDIKSNWITYIQGFQAEDGLFHDPQIECELVDEVDWWGWRHLTLHVLMALSVLQGTAQRPFRLLDPFKESGYMTKWLDTQHWQSDAASWSNKIQNYGVMLQYSRDFQGQNWCNNALDEMYCWLDTHQDPKTGYWGYGYQTPRERSLGVQTGYHIWLLYLYDKRPIQYVERIIDSCLATQNRLGGFGVSLNSSACEDIDSIDPLVRFSFMTDYRKKDIHAALEKTLFWVLANFNVDGGWVFRRGEDFLYRHKLMWAQVHQSSMFPTWFRTLSLAYLAMALPEKSISELGWKFGSFPGLQFWH